MKKILLSFFALILAFTLIGCNKKENEVQVELDAVVGKLIVSDLDAVTSNVTLYKTVQTVYDITWTVTGSENATIGANRNGEPMLIITRGEEWQEFKLTATIKKDEYSSSKDFTGYIKPVDADVKVLTCQGACDAATNTIVLITGTVYYLTSQGFWMCDESGRIYVYTNDEPTATYDVQLGDEVSVSGTKTLYYGFTHEITSPSISITKYGDGTYNIKSSEITVDELQEIQKATISELTAGNLEKTKLGGTFYKVEGIVVPDVNSSGKYTWAIQSFYSNNSMTIYDSQTSAETLATLKSLEGKYVSLTVMLFDLYSSTFFRYIALPGTIAEATEPTVTDAEKISGAKDICNAIESDVYTNLELPTTVDKYEGVTITWASSNEAVLGIDGTLGTSENVSEEVTLTATIVAGELTETVTLNLTVWFVTKSTIKEANKVTDANASAAVWIEGKIIATDSNGEYFYVADETGVAYIYSKLTAYSGFAIGNTVKIIGSTEMYYGGSSTQYTREIIIKNMEKLETEITPISSAKVDLADLAVNPVSGELNDANKAVISASKFFGALYEITGYVTIRGKYNNIYIAVENDTTSAAVLYYYKSNNQTELKALEGKLVTIVAPVLDYTLSDGWRLGSYVSVVEGEGTADPTPTQTVLQARTIGDSNTVTVLGTITYVYEGYGFMLKDETACIYVYVKGDTSAYSVGDKVLVSGTTGTYNGAQITTPTVTLVKYDTYEYNPIAKTTAEFLALEYADANFGLELSIAGTLVKNDKGYINLKIDDTNTANLYLTSAQKELLADYVDKEVTVTVITYAKVQNKTYPFNLFIVVESVIENPAA